MAEASSTEPKKERFAPKVPVNLDPPKDDPITLGHLAKCDGEHEGYPTYVAIKGTVFDVTGNATYGPGKNYHVLFLKNDNRTTQDQLFQFLHQASGIEAALIESMLPVFTGKEPNRALGLSSLKPEDCVPEWEDLDEGSKKTLDDWYTFFSKRYNIVGKVQRP